MGKQFDGLFGNRVRGLSAASTTLLRQSLWLMLFLLGWASTAQAAIPASERQVLLDLYASTNGAGWTNNTNWNGAVGTECTWWGITCSGSSVYVISLSSNNLVGTLPSLGGLTALGYFFVDNNQLTGSIPSLSGLTVLQNFNVGHNQLTGSIPSLGGLAALRIFTVQSNQLTGSIPSLSGLTALQHFIVDNNKLTGSIPSLGGLAALQDFYANDNQLTGSIPSLNGLTALHNFRVGSNQLSGSIPSLSGLTTLYFFTVDNNQLTGPIPVAPTSLPAGQSNLCSNSLVSSGDPAIDAAWTTATGTDWLACQTAATTLYTLAVTRTGSGTGNITSSTGGIDCGTSCWADYASGTSVTLTATPSSGSYFAGWTGDCTGTGSCVVTMSAAKNVTATFKPVPFVAATTSTITATSATISTTITFNAADVGKQGAVYVTAWAPANGLSSFGLTAGLSKALSVTTTSDNPYLADKVNRRQETLGTLLAATTNTWVLVQKTPSGWQLVVNGQLIPYTTGVLGDSLAAQSILNNTDPTNLLGAQFCVGYGTSDSEMIASGRMMPVAIIPDANGKAATNGSCNVTDVVVVEFYNVGINHYFMTASLDEAVVLDNKTSWGWVRTGKTFNVWLNQATAPGNASPVCRFFGVFSNGTVGSHFYTADPAECAYVKGRLDWGWGYENDAFYAVQPTGSTCPSGTSPVYRVFNNGIGGAPNHRYMANQADVDTMVSQGWVSEGSGTAFCGAQ